MFASSLLLSVLLCIISFFFVVDGYLQLSEGVPGFYYSRSIAELQGDANELLLGIGKMLCGIALLLGGAVASVFALTFAGRRNT